MLINETLFEILNETADGYQVYYNKKSKQFECYDDSDHISKNLIKTPCVCEMKYAIKQEFFSLLSEEEKDVARSYPFRRGYFDYLVEVGLYGVYKQAEHNVKIKALEAWFTGNNICVPTNSGNGYI